VSDPGKGILRSAAKGFYLLVLLNRP